MRVNPIPPVFPAVAWKRAVNNVQALSRSEAEIIMDRCMEIHDRIGRMKAGHEEKEHLYKMLGDFTEALTKTRGQL